MDKPNLTMEEARDAVQDIGIETKPLPHQHQAQQTVQSMGAFGRPNASNLTDKCSCGATRRRSPAGTVKRNWEGGIKMPQTGWQLAVWDAVDLAVTHTPPLADLQPNIVTDLYDLIMDTPNGRPGDKEQLANIYAVVRSAAYQLKEQQATDSEYIDQLEAGREGRAEGNY